MLLFICSLMHCVHVYIFANVQYILFMVACCCFVSAVGHWDSLCFFVRPGMPPPVRFPPPNPRMPHHVSVMWHCIGRMIDWGLLQHSKVTCWMTTPTLVKESNAYRKLLHFLISPFTPLSPTGSPRPPTPDENAVPSTPTTTGDNSSIILPWLWASIEVTHSYSSRPFLCTLA